MNEIQKQQMKVMNNSCCGSYSKQKVAKVKEKIPPNPKMNGGVALIYVGSGRKSFKGHGTGSVYYVSDHSRHFRVYTEDADSILSNTSIIRKP
jgi:hypothetical protein